VGAFACQCLFFGRCPPFGGGCGSGPSLRRTPLPPPTPPRGGGCTPPPPFWVWPKAEGRDFFPPDFFGWISPPVLKRSLLCATWGPASYFLVFEAGPGQGTQHSFEESPAREKVSVHVTCSAHHMKLDGTINARPCCRCGILVCPGYISPGFIDI